MSKLMKIFISTASIIKHLDAISTKGCRTIFDQQVISWKRYRNRWVFPVADSKGGAVGRPPLPLLAQNFYQKAAFSHIVRWEHLR